MNRFLSLSEIGEGSFSKIFQAFDTKLNIYVALKVEKEDKLKRILKAEYEIMQKLQGLKHIPKLYGFFENVNLSKQLTGLNFIEMDLLGKNLSQFKKISGYFNNILAYDILLQSLRAIEDLHNKGFIHRDIKPTNFVLGKNDECNFCNCFPNSNITIYMVDFGLAKNHLDNNLVPFPARQNTDFRGTLTYASLNAHYKLDLSRRDDLWSYFFMILDLLNENLPWRNCIEDREEIKKEKENCLKNPQKYLFLGATKNKIEILKIFNHLVSLKYESKPDYDLIYNQIYQMKMYEIKAIYDNYYRICLYNFYGSQLNNFSLYQNCLNNCYLKNDNLNITNINNNIYNNDNNILRYLGKKQGRENIDNTQSNILSKNNINTPNNNNITINTPFQNQNVIINYFKNNFFFLEGKIGKYFSNMQENNNNNYYYKNHNNSSLSNLFNYNNPFVELEEKKNNLEIKNEKLNNKKSDGIKQKSNYQNQTKSKKNENKSQKKLIFHIIKDVMH